MKEIKLFLDMEFTSLSPDAQPISLGVVSDCGKSFYSEFTDFDVERCDDWVKENVVNKLFYPKEFVEGRGNLFSELEHENIGSWSGFGGKEYVISALKEWLKQFSDYQIQIVVDCGTFDWYHFLQLVAEWDTKKQLAFSEAEHYSKPEHLRHEEELKLFLNAKGRNIVRFREKVPQVNISVKPDVVSATIQDDSSYYVITKTGLPKLPSIISPVPLDLNDLIAFKMGISVKDAFDMNREELSTYGEIGTPVVVNALAEKNKHNSLWDAKVIKAIYEKLV